MPIHNDKPSRTRRVLCFDPPTLNEAIFAAQGLADDVEGQREISSRLMGLPEAKIRANVLKATATTAHASTNPSPSRSVSARPTVVVKRRMSRLLMR
jgi:hypothetical protein